MASNENIEKIIILLPEILKKLFHGTMDSDHDVSHAQCKVLYALGFKGDLTMSDLSSNMGVEMSSATVLVDSLVADSLVDRERDEKDRRVVKVKLTKKGQEKFKNLKGQLVKNFDRIFNKISMEKQKVLIDAFEQLHKVLTEVE